MSPEEAREAAKSLVDAWCVTSSGATDRAAVILKLEDAIVLLLLSASPGVEVRPLEWVVNPRDSRRLKARTILGDYEVYERARGGWKCVMLKGTPDVDCESFDEGKAMCDQHYRARIGLALRTAGGGG